MTQKQIVAAAAAILIGGVVLGSLAGGRGPKPHPWAPEKDRPVLKFLARIAKTFLWVALVAEKNPTARHNVVQATSGADGYQTLDNRRGW